MEKDPEVGRSSLNASACRGEQRTKDGTRQLLRAVVPRGDAGCCGSFRDAPWLARAMARKTRIRGESWPHPGNWEGVDRERAKRPCGSCQVDSERRLGGVEDGPRTEAHALNWGTPLTGCASEARESEKELLRKEERALGGPRGNDKRVRQAR